MHSVFTLTLRKVRVAILHLKNSVKASELKSWFLRQSSDLWQGIAIDVMSRTISRDWIIHELDPAQTLNPNLLFLAQKEKLSQSKPCIRSTYFYVRMCAGVAHHQTQMLAGMLNDGKQVEKHRDPSTKRFLLSCSNVSLTVISFPARDSELQSSQVFHAGW